VARQKKERKKIKLKIKIKNESRILHRANKIYSSYVICPTLISSKMVLIIERLLTITEKVK